MLIPGDDGESETVPSVAHPRRHSGHLLHSSSQLPRVNQSMGEFRKRNEVPGADTGTARASWRFAARRSVS